MQLELIDHLAHRAKRSYCRARERAQRIDQYRPGDDKYWKYWEKIGQMALEHGFQPEEFIEVMFSLYKPWPNIASITGKTALRQFRENRRSVSDTQRVAFEVQRKTLKRLIELGNRPEEVIVDPRNNFDPLFVYVAALAHDLVEICQSVRMSAMATYMMSEAYDDIYGRAIPQDFRTVKQELRKES